MKTEVQKWNYESEKKSHLAIIVLHLTDCAL